MFRLLAAPPLPFPPLPSALAGGVLVPGQPAIHYYSGGEDSKMMRYQGNLVCFHYNNRNMVCTRKAAGDGCDNGRGGIFAHVCNFQLAAGKLCFGKHKRHEQH